MILPVDKFLIEEFAPCSKLAIELIFIPESAVISELRVNLNLVFVSIVPPGEDAFKSASLPMYAVSPLTDIFPLELTVL